MTARNPQQIDFERLPRPRGGWAGVGAPGAPEDAWASSWGGACCGGRGRSLVWGNMGVYVRAKQVGRGRTLGGGYRFPVGGSPWTGAPAGLRHRRHGDGHFGRMHTLRTESGARKSLPSDKDNPINSRRRWKRERFALYWTAIHIHLIYVKNENDTKYAGVKTMEISDAYNKQYLKKFIQWRQPFDLKWMSFKVLY